MDSIAFNLLYNIIYPLLYESAGKLLTNIKSVSSYTDLFKAKLLCFSFCNKITCSMFLLWPSIALAFTHPYFISRILLVLIAEWSASIILDGNLREDFCLTRKLDKSSSTLLSAYPKFLNKCKISLFSSIYIYVIEALYFNSSDFICTILLTIFSILLFKILFILSLYD